MEYVSLDTPLFYARSNVKMWLRLIVVWFRCSWGCGSDSEGCGGSLFGWDGFSGCLGYRSKRICGVRIDGEPPGAGEEAGSVWLIMCSLGGRFSEFVSPYGTQN